MSTKRTRPEDIDDLGAIMVCDCTECGDIIAYGEGWGEMRTTNGFSVYHCHHHACRPRR